MNLSLGKDNPHEAAKGHFICPVPQETKPDGKRRTVIHGLNDSFCLTFLNRFIVRNQLLH